MVLVQAGFSEMFLKNAKPPQPTEYFDTKVKGLGVRVLPTGHCTFFVICRSGYAKKRQAVGVWVKSDPTGLGLSEARDRARALQIAFRGRRRPGEETQEDLFPIVLFGELARRYMEEYSKVQKSTWTSDDYHLNRFLLPPWKDTPAADITPRMILDFLKTIRDTPVMHNHVKCLISSIYKWGIHERLVELNPAAGIQPERTKARSGVSEHVRVYSESEIRKIWTALDKMPLCEAAYYRFAFMVAQRLGNNMRGAAPQLAKLTKEQTSKRTKAVDRGEILMMEWAEIDWDQSWWTIPGNRTKNQIPMRVPLMPEALELLRQVREDQRRRKLTARYVWIMTHAGQGRTARTAKERQDPQSSTHTRPSYWGKGELRPPLYMKRQYMKIRKLSGVKDFTQHNIRRTVATMLTSSGVKKEELARLLNHESRNKNQDVTAIYDLYEYDLEKRDIVDFWSTKLKLILANAPTQHLNFRAFVEHRWGARRLAEAQRLQAEDTAPASTS